MNKNELDILLPESDITINGETIEIKPFPFSKLPKVIDALSKMGGGIYLLLADDGLKFNERGNVTINQTFLEKIGPLVDEHFPELIELIAIYTGKESSFYSENEAFTAEDGLLLIAGIIERNYDFFTKRLFPAIQKISTKAKKTK